MKKQMGYRNKIYYALVVLFFYLGDIITTYFGLQKGGHETNIFLAPLGLNGIIIVKTIFILMVLVFVSYLEKQKKYEKEIGIMLGSIIAVGLFTVLINIGFYRY